MGDRDASCPRTSANGDRCGRPLALGLDHCAICETGDRLHRERTTCFVCNHDEEYHVARIVGGSAVSVGHSFWSVYDARREAEEHDRRTTVRYSSGATTPEAAYVNQHRPY